MKVKNQLCVERAVPAESHEAHLLIDPRIAYLETDPRNVDVNRIKEIREKKLDLKRKEN